MDTIPFTPGLTFEKLRVELSGVRFLFFSRWNARDYVDPDTGEEKGAWYVDLYADDLTPIAIGLKLVLGPPLGRAYTHDFFQRHILQVIDTSGESRDAGFDDLGGRIQVIHVAVG